MTGLEKAQLVEEALVGKHLPLGGSTRCGLPFPGPRAVTHWETLTCVTCAQECLESHRRYAPSWPTPGSAAWLALRRLGLLPDG